MNLNYRTLSRITGTLFLIVGFSMILPFITGLIYGEYTSSRAFLIVMVPLLIIGTLHLVFIKASPKQLKKRDGFLIVSWSWILLSLLSAIPFVIQGAIPHYVDAFFETCSGFSTTGSSILTDIEALPKSMLFWRSFTHWLGGMGILVFAVALLPALGITGQTLVKAEAPGPMLSKITPKMSDMARNLYIIYGSCTVLETGLLMLGGLNLYDALIHTFGTVGTGGFSNYNHSVAAFDSAYIDGVITIFMIISGANFSLYFLAISRGLKVFKRDAEFRLYSLFLILATSLTTIYLFASQTYTSILTAFRYAAFQVASIITTTGFVTADFDKWPTFCIMILLCLFFIGGCSSSTGGGIKVIRILVILKMIKRTVALKLHPNALVQIKVDNKILPTDTVQEICSFIFLYVIIIFSVGFVVSFDNHDIITSFSAAATCLGNIGPGFYEIGPTMNFSCFSGPVKIILSLTMIAGRLELFTFLMLLSKRFWNPSH